MDACILPRARAPKQTVIRIFNTSYGASPKNPGGPAQTRRFENRRFSNTRFHKEIGYPGGRSGDRSEQGLGGLVLAACGQSQLDALWPKNLGVLTKQARALCAEEAVADSHGFAAGFHGFQCGGGNALGVFAQEIHHEFAAVAGVVIARDNGRVEL